MPISLVGTPQIGGKSSGGNVTLTFDGSPAQNDVAVVFGGCVGAAGLSTGGYTPIASTATGLHFGAWYKVMGAIPDTTVVGLGDGSSQSAVAYGSYVLRGVDPAVLDVAAVLSVNSGVPPDNPPITTATDGAWVLAVAGRIDSTNALGVVTGYSNAVGLLQVDTHRMGTAGGTKLVATHGTEDPPASWQSDTNAWCAITIAIKPAGGTATVSGAAAIGATASVAVGGKVTEVAATAITAGASVSAAGVVTRLGAAPITASASTTVAGSVTDVGAASVAGTASVSVAGENTDVAAASIGVAASTTATGAVTDVAAAGITAAAAVTTAGTASGSTGTFITVAASTSTAGLVTTGGTVVIAAAATLSAQGVGATSGAAPVDVQATVGATGLALIGALSIAAAARLAVSGSNTATGAAPIGATASLTATGGVLFIAACAILAQADVDAAGTVGIAPTVRMVVAFLLAERAYSFRPAERAYTFTVAE